MKLTKFGSILVILCFSLSVYAVPTEVATVYSGNSEGMAFRVEEVTQGLEIPWGMAFLNPSEIIFTQRNGRIGILYPETGRTMSLSGTLPKVRTGDQGGLLDVSVPPDYPSSGWIFFTYSKDVAGMGATALARARRQQTRLTNWEDLLVTRSVTDSGRHYGSRIAFDDKGHLFFSVGDRGFRPNGQDLTTHAGSILRLNRDGSIPRDNPFIDKGNALAEIYSYGHRNPQGIAFDAVNQRLWAIEHGPRGGDEINLIRPGRNYGWPVISYGKEYWGPVQVGEGTEKKGMEQPVKYYVPSIAPGSLLVYTGRAFPKWQGNLFSGALKLEHINRVVLDAAGRPVAEERLLKDLEVRIRALIESPEGWIYFSTDSGQILRIRPAD